MIRLAAVAMFVAVPAWAQDRPATSPTRDVDVTYSAPVGDKLVQQRSRFAVSAQKIRIDPPSPGLYVIVDRSKHAMDMVSDGDHAVLKLPYDPAPADGVVPLGQTYQREGADTVAGVPCTEWQTTDSRGQPVVACFTADGVFLRARAGANILVQAIKVTYGLIDPNVFVIPTDYKRVAGRGASP